MFEDLDAVDWNSLSNAYEEASEIPGLIRAAASPDADESDEALDDLSAHICHQGSVYESSAAAAPFLIEALREPTVANKAGILGLLTGLATGSSFLDVHVERGVGPIEVKWRGEPDYAANLGRERAAVAATRDAVILGLPAYLDLLAGGDESVRIPAAGLLAALNADKDRVSAAFREAYRRETKNGIRCGLLIGLGEIGVEGDVPFLRQILLHGEGDLAALLASKPAEPDRAIRWGAAVALVRILRAKAPPEAIRVLVDALHAGKSRHADWAGLPDGEQESAHAAMLTFRLIGPEASIPILAGALRTVDPADIPEVVEHLLDLSFPLREDTPDRHPSRTPQGLSPLQKTALAALASSGEVWDPAWRVGPQLEWLGLPGSRAALAAFLGA